MFCTNCGTKLSENDHFCSNCGMQISENKTVPTTPTENTSFIMELNGVKFDAFRFALEQDLFNKKGFFSTVTIDTELQKITKANTSSCDKMVKELRKNVELKNAILKYNDNMNSPAVRCPKCSSKNVHLAEKGYSGTKGFIGGILTGGIGLLAGFHGRHNLRGQCLNCGHKWSL